MRAALFHKGREQQSQSGLQQSFCRKQQTKVYKNRIWILDNILSHKNHASEENTD